MTHARNAKLKTCASCYSVVELVFDSHGVLCANGIHTVCHVAVGEIEVGLGSLAQAISKLRTKVYEEGYALALPTPRQMRHDRNLDVVDGALIFFGQPCCGIYHGLVVDIKNIFFPSHLAIVYFAINGADGIKIFLTYIPRRQTGINAS